MQKVKRDQSLYESTKRAIVKDKGSLPVYKVYNQTQFESVYPYNKSLITFKVNEDLVNEDKFQQKLE